MSEPTTEQRLAWDAARMRNEDAAKEQDRKRLVAAEAEVAKLREELEEARGCKPDAWEHLKASERMFVQRADRAEAERDQLRTLNAELAEAIQKNVKPGRCGYCPPHWNNHAGCWVAALAKLEEPNRG